MQEQKEDVQGHAQGTALTYKDSQGQANIGNDSQGMPKKGKGSFWTERQRR
jgi:hypothetical protein